MVRFLKAAAALLCAVGLSAFAQINSVGPQVAAYQFVGGQWTPMTSTFSDFSIFNAPAMELYCLNTTTNLWVPWTAACGGGGGGSTSPGGTQGAFQYNASGSFGGVALTGLVVGNGTGAPTSVAAPAGAVVGTTDTQTLTNKTVNGVTLSAAGSSTTFLNGAGAYTTPAGSGTVTNFVAGNLIPLFTSNVTNPSTAPALTFTLSAAAQNSVFAGPATGGAGAPSYQTAPTFSAANLTNFPTFNQNTTGSAAKITSNGTANQVWGMNSGGTAQGWFTPTGGGGGLADCTDTSGVSIICTVPFTAATIGTNGTTPGTVGIVAGTGNIPALAANSAGFAAPATGGTAYRYKLPATAAAGILHAAAPATNDGVNESALTASAVSLTADVSGILPVANGGTGTTTPAIVAGSNVTVSGTWPNQTINASGGGGSIAGIYSVNSGPTTNSTVSASVAVGVTTIPMVSTTGYVLGTTGVPAWYKVITGQFSAPVEMSCTGGTATSLTGCTRGLLGTTDAAFTSGMAVWELDKIFFGTSTSVAATLQRSWGGMWCVDGSGQCLNNLQTNGFGIQDSLAYVGQFGTPVDAPQFFPKNGTGSTLVTVGAGAGTGATVALVGTNVAGTITLNTGTTTTASSVLFTVTFDSTLNDAPFGCQLYPRTANATGLLTYTTAPTTTTWTANVGTTALPASATAITWSYQCI